jgi:hypothetical protein
MAPTEETHVSSTAGMDLAYGQIDAKEVQSCHDALQHPCGVHHGERVEVVLRHELP